MTYLPRFLSETSWQWWVGLGLTLIVIFLLTWNIILTKSLIQKFNKQNSEVTGYSTERLDEMWLKINAIDRNINTMPLAECGNRKRE